MLTAMTEEDWTIVLRVFAASRSRRGDERLTPHPPTPEPPGQKSLSRASCKPRDVLGVSFYGQLLSNPYASGRIAMNAINVIAPYKHLGMWVFDDARVGLSQEPFVAGADAMIDRVVADIPNADQGFTLIFAATPFPGHQYRLDWVRADEDGGNWYRSADLDMEGCLCPALFRYFDQAPKELYAQVKARG